MFVRTGFTAGGDVLNCDTYEVGLHAALEVGFLFYFAV